MKSFLRNNGLSLVVFAIFALLFAAQSIVGYERYNNDQQEHNQEMVTYGAYLRTGHFLEAVGENWESEFLQMAVYVFFTSFLYQKGSAESKDPDSDNDVDKAPEPKPNAPWPVRKGGIVLKLYEYSLTMALLVLFLISFAMHAAGGSAEYCAEEREHGRSDCPNAIQYIGTSQFWFESFQNWQSEFLAVGSIVVLSIYLRQKGSPESKPVDASHRETPKD